MTGKTLTERMEIVALQLEKILGNNEIVEFHYKFDDNEITHIHWVDDDGFEVKKTEGWIENHG